MQVQKGFPYQHIPPTENHEPTICSARRVTGIALRCPLPVHAGEAEASAAYKKGDYITALRELKPLAEQGSANAQIQLGFMYANAKGVPQDYDQAMSWFRKAAEQRNATAQFNLGLMHYQGRGTPKDYTLASEWYRRAADQGYGFAKLRPAPCSSRREGCLAAHDRGTREALWG